METTKHFLVAASVSLALALTFGGCSSEEIAEQLRGGGDSSSSDGDGTSSESIENSGGSSSSVERQSSSSVEGGCYFYENGYGGYDYKCGMEPPCYPDPSCPECDVCYPYPTKCDFVDTDCPEHADCQRAYQCREVLRYVEEPAPDDCCMGVGCYKGEGWGCPAVCVPAVKLGMQGYYGGERYACGINNGSSASSSSSVVSSSSSAGMPLPQPHSNTALFIGYWQGCEGPGGFDENGDCKEYNTGYTFSHGEYRQGNCTVTWKVISDTQVVLEQCASGSQYFVTYDYVFSNENWSVHLHQRSGAICGAIGCGEIKLYKLGMGGLD